MAPELQEEKVISGNVTIYASVWCRKSYPGHGTRIARGLVRYKYYQLLFIRSISEFLNPVLQMILVTAPELQEDGSGTITISISLYLDS